MRFEAVLVVPVCFRSAFYYNNELQHLQASDAVLIKHITLSSFSRGSAVLQQLLTTVESLIRLFWTPFCIAAKSHAGLEFNHASPNTDGLCTEEGEVGSVQLGTVNTSQPI